VGESAHAFNYTTLNMADNNNTEVVLLGHSFIRRLCAFMNKFAGFKNLRLNQWLINVVCRAKGGLTIPRLIHERPDLFTFNFNGDSRSIVYLQLGGNDLSSSSGVDVAKEVFSFANFLHHGLHCKVVIIGQLLWRDPSKSHRVDQDYNNRVVAANTTLLNYCNNMEACPNVIFWRHHGFWQDLSFICDDGVHLNDDGMEKYFRSVRSAVLHAQRLLGNIYSS
jgi:hypothetical protein